jgi:hypothetical protein
MLLFGIQAKDSKFSPEQQLSEFTFSLSHPEASLKFPAATEKVHTRCQLIRAHAMNYSQEYIFCSIFQEIGKLLRGDTMVIKTNLGQKMVFSECSFAVIEESTTA